MPKSADFLKLFNATGQEIPVTREQLLSIEALKPLPSELAKMVGGRSGRYWLISDRPNCPAKIVEFALFEEHPRPSGKWTNSWYLGNAETPGFDLEEALRVFSEPIAWASASEDIGIPKKVARLAREHVVRR